MQSGRVSDGSVNLRCLIGIVLMAELPRYLYDGAWQPSGSVVSRLLTLPNSGFDLSLRSTIRALMLAAAGWGAGDDGRCTAIRSCSSSAKVAAAAPMSIWGAPGCSGLRDRMTASERGAGADLPAAATAA